MPKPSILAAACSALALSGCVAQRADAVARAQAPVGDVTAVTSTRLIADASSARWSTPGVAAKSVAGKAINATCPVMLGNPVDPKVTTEWKGATVAFCDASARSTWAADPSRYAGNLPAFPSLSTASGPTVSGPTVLGVSRLSGSGTDLAPVARRKTPSAARVVAAIPKAPVAGAAIGSPDAAPAVVAPIALRAMPLATVPAAPVPTAALGSPDGAPLTLPAPRPVTAVAAPAPKPIGTPVRASGNATIKVPARVPVTPPSTPSVPLGDDHGDDEECPGGVCRVPGM